MDNIIVNLVGKNINETNEYYRYVFKSKIKDAIFYFDFSASKTDNYKYEYFLKTEIVFSKSFGKINEKYIITNSSYETSLEYLSSNKGKIKFEPNSKEFKCSMERLNELISLSKNTITKEYLSFAILKISEEAKHLDKIPNFVISSINNREKYMTK